MRAFADHFSRDAASYAKFRPQYPPALMEWLASLPEHRRVAWDAGTGSGQAAVLLAGHFPLVVASDGSRSQVSAARRAPGVHYLVARAEASALAERRVDLVTVAQAMHWLDPDRFFDEVERVIAPGGALAVLSYGLFRSTPEVDRIVARFYGETVGPYWPPERAHVEDGYRRFRLPLAEVAAPAFAIEGHLSLPQLLGFIGTWSAVGRFRAEQGTDPVKPLEAELATVWGPPERAHHLEWPIAVRAGRWRWSGAR